MCGIAILCGSGWDRARLERMVTCQRHRGPDAVGLWESASRDCALGHRRLSILDLSDAGRQPMATRDGRFQLVFNGEIYNYIELREELGGRSAFATGTDSEVLLAAFARWGEACLPKLCGMFAFAIWDEREQKLFAARDRFGVKPLYIHEPAGGGLWMASEIKALHAAGVERRPHEATWATYLASGMYDHASPSFWAGVWQLPPGGCLTWSAKRGLATRSWYDSAQVFSEQGLDERSDCAVFEELLGLLETSVSQRFRSDVPVGVCLSGGLDSSLLLGLVHRIQGAESDVKSFTFYCDDERYDETPWVEQMLAHTRHPAFYCRLQAEEIPALAARVQASQDEPFGGFPTLGMAKVFERARAEGCIVLLDGSGLDEGWAGYEYYARPQSVDPSIGPVQGSRSPSVRPGCLRPEFAARATRLIPENAFGDPLRALQYRDIRHAKIPRALRFSDRVSMMHSCELREPFLDYRIMELGLRQPPERKIRNGQGKWLPRRVAERILPSGVREAPKRPVQTPQREWLRGPLAGWAETQIEHALAGWGRDWLDPIATRAAWQDYRHGHADNSFPVWQWISLGLLSAAQEQSG